MCAGLWGNVGGVYVPGREQWDGGECDVGGNAEQWNYDSGGQSDAGDDYGVGDSLRLAVRVDGHRREPVAFLLGRFASGLSMQGKAIELRSNGQPRAAVPTFISLGLHILERGKHYGECD